jgi:hypothetical protein
MKMSAAIRTADTDVKTIQPMVSIDIFPAIPVKKKSELV